MGSREIGESSSAHLPVAQRTFVRAQEANKHSACTAASAQVDASNASKWMMR